MKRKAAEAKKVPAHCMTVVRCLDVSIVVTDAWDEEERMSAVTFCTAHVDILSIELCCHVQESTQDARMDKIKRKLNDDMKLQSGAAGK